MVKKLLVLLLVLCLAFVAIVSASDVGDDGQSDAGEGDDSGSDDGDGDDGGNDGSDDAALRVAPMSGW